MGTTTQNCHRHQHLASLRSGRGRDCAVGNKGALPVSAPELGHGRLRGKPQTAPQLSIRRQQLRSVPAGNACNFFCLNKSWTELACMEEHWFHIPVAASTVHVTSLRLVEPYSFEALRGRAVTWNCSGATSAAALAAAWVLKAVRPCCGAAGYMTVLAMALHSLVTWSLELVCTSASTQILDLSFLLRLHKAETITVLHSGCIRICCSSLLLSPSPTLINQVAA